MIFVLREYRLEGDKAKESQFLDMWTVAFTKSGANVGLKEYHVVNRSRMRGWIRGR